MDAGAIGVLGERVAIGSGGWERYATRADELLRVVALTGVVAPLGPLPHRG
ncbi:MAG: hypothetical protein WKF73_21620 [Nocardioidaceae bacterium]